MKRSPLTRKTPLRRKTALKAYTKVKKPKLESLPSLVKKADTAFSRYVRLRDSEYVEGEWLGVCITCPRRLVIVDREGRWNAGANLGHFVGRAAKSLRWDELNCNMQCAHCNAWRDKESMITAYRKALDDKYGAGTARKLVREGKVTHKPTREELHQVIEDSKTYVAYMLQNTDKYSIV